jgi:hypothetical protein
MDEINSLKIEQTSQNYYNLKNKNKNIKIKLNKVLCPFGIDEQYGHSIIKFELDQTNDKHIEVICQLRDFENKLKEQFHSNDEEWKSLINLRENNNIFIEARIKKMKNKLITKLTFDDNDTNYLKTIYELNKNFTSDILLEIPILWDFRKENNNINKIGLLVNLTNIHVY